MMVIMMIMVPSWLADGMAPDVAAPNWFNNNAYFGGVDGLSGRVVQCVAREAGDLQNM